MTRRPASSSALPRPLAGASTLARRAAPGARSAPVAFRKRAPAPPPARLQELERLDVGQVLVLADDVRLPHRLEELPRAVEVPQADLDAAQSLSDVAVRAGPRDDPVLAGEPHCLLVEGGEGDSRVEDLEDVDFIEDLEEVLVVGHRVQPVEGMRDVDEATLPAYLRDRLGHRHPALDALGQEEAEPLS